jgi:hypothetical protein
MVLIGLIAVAARAGDAGNGFIPGEVVEYKVSWAGLPLAWSKTSTDTLIEDGQERIRIRVVSQTYKAYAHIYKVDDVTEVIIDPETALPIRVDVTLNEGNRHRSHRTTFYHDKKVAVFQDRISKDIREVPIQSDTQDILSFIFARRNDDLEALASKRYQLLVDGKIYDLRMKIHKEGEIKLPAYGKVPSIQVEPIAEFDGLFLRKGKVKFWVSKQNRRMVTCIHARVPVGRISVKLQNVSGPGDDFWVNTKE